MQQVENRSAQAATAHDGAAPPKRGFGLVALPLFAVGLAVAVRLVPDIVDALPFAAEVALSIVILAITVATVFVVLAHAEAIAHRVGEPYGTLILTLAVTTIEASVIVSMMLHGENNPTLARESVFSTVMIVCAGVVGICLTLGGLRHRQQDLKRQGTSALLAVIIALAGLTLVLPHFTLGAGPGNFTVAQLGLVSLLCILLYGSFLLAQITRHREDFIDAGAPPVPAGHGKPSGRLPVRVLLLIVGLVGIVLLAEFVAAGLEEGLVELDVPQPDAVIGAFIATLVLLPESISAIRASYRNELQRSLNIALGSACATIGLTIPVVAVAAIVTGHGLTLGLEPGDIVLLLLALAVSMVSFGTGRTNALTGGVHLVIFVAYLLLIAVP